MMTLRAAITVSGLVLLCSSQVMSADLPAHLPDASTAPPREESGIWAAISYSQSDGKEGFFWGADKRKEAEEYALRHCSRAGGKDCSIVAVFRNHRHWDDDDHTGFPYNHCGALAVGKTTLRPSGPWAAQTAQTLRQAEDLSLRACESGGNQCRILEWVCT